MRKRFEILDYLDRLVGYKRTNTQIKHICPVCDGNNLAVNIRTGKWKCWDGCDNYAVKKAIAPEIYSNPFAAVELYSKPEVKEEYPLPIALTGERLAHITLSPVIEHSNNKTVYYYDDHHRVVRWDNVGENRVKVLTPYHKKDTNWCKGVDSDWLPFVAKESTPGVYLGVEGEKCVQSLLDLNLTAFTFAPHCWHLDALIQGLDYIKSLPGFKGLLYIADNDNAGRAKGRKIALAARKCNIPHQIINIVDVWYYVTDLLCPKAADIADLLEITDFNLEYLICSTVIKPPSSILKQ